MRWRAGAVLAVIGIAAIPGVSDALVPSGKPVKVSVKPASGSPTTHFEVSFRAAQTTGIVGGTSDTYRVTASDSARAGCQGSIAAVAPPTHAGATVRVKLAPKAHGRWCAGTFHGQLWNIVFPRCPAGKACPAIAFPPQMVGKFSFRVTGS
jgi:hypothetical protein